MSKKSSLELAIDAYKRSKHPTEMGDDELDAHIQSIRNDAEWIKGIGVRHGHGKAFAQLLTAQAIDAAKEKYKRVQSTPRLEEQTLIERFIDHDAKARAQRLIDNSHATGANIGHFIGGMLDAAHLGATLYMAHKHHAFPALLNFRMDKRLENVGAKIGNRVGLMLAARAVGAKKLVKKVKA